MSIQNNMSSSLLNKIVILDFYRFYFLGMKLGLWRTQTQGVWKQVAKETIFNLGGGINRRQ
jgi:hypothetical protein